MNIEFFVLSFVDQICENKDFTLTFFTSKTISPNCDLQPLRLASKLFQSSTLEAETLTPTFDPGSCELDGTHIVVKNSLFSSGVSELWKTFHIRFIRAGEYCAAIMIRFKLYDLF